MKLKKCQKSRHQNTYCCGANGIVVDKRNCWPAASLPLDPSADGGSGKDANQPSWSPSPLKQSNLLRARSSSTCSPPLPCSSRPPPPLPPLTPHPAQSTRRGPRPCPHPPAPPKIDHPINRLLALTPDPFPWIAPPPTTAAVPVAPPPPAARTRTSASTSSAAPSARPRRRRPRSHSPPQTALPSPSRRSTTSARTSSATSSSS